MLTKTLFAALALTLASAGEEQPAEKTKEVTEIPELTETPEVVEIPEATETPELTDNSELTETPELAETKEHTVTAGPFSIKTEISGILVPAKIQTLTLAPERWKTFTIVSIPDHGAEIKAGEPLVTFKTKAIAQALLEQVDTVSAQELKLAIANRKLTELQQKNALSLSAAKQRMNNAEADLAYYEATGLPARKESIAQAQQQSEDFLSYQKEELNQLLKMYQEDDLTEETEEIILTRQKASVRNAENNLNDVKRRGAHTLEISLPREIIELQEKVETARIDYATAKLNLERNFELKKLEVAKLERSLASAKEALAELEADRKLFDIIAEFDGNLLYGEFTDGQWKKGKTSDFLKVGGNVPTNKTPLTLVAKGSPLALHALLETKKVQALQASLAESGAEAPQVTIAPYPNTSGKHLVTLAAQPSLDLQFPGQQDKSDLTFYQVDNAITIPNNAFKTKEDGVTYVMLKLSEGGPEERAIELGRKSKKVVEVLSGLEEGQVILP